MTVKFCNRAQESWEACQFCSFAPEIYARFNFSLWRGIASSWSQGEVSLDKVDTGVDCHADLPSKGARLGMWHKDAHRRQNTIQTSQIIASSKPVVNNISCNGNFLKTCKFSDKHGATMHQQGKAVHMIGLLGYGSH